MLLFLTNQFYYICTVYLTRKKNKVHTSSNDRILNFIDIRFIKTLISWLMYNKVIKIGVKFDLNVTELPLKLTFSMAINYWLV